MSRGGWMGSPPSTVPSNTAKVPASCTSTQLLPNFYPVSVSAIWLLCTRWLTVIAAQRPRVCGDNEHFWGSSGALASGQFASTAPCVTFRRVVVSLRGPGQSPVLPFACCVGSTLSVGRCGRCSCWCRFRIRGGQWLVCRGCAGRDMVCRLRKYSLPPPLLREQRQKH